MNTRNIAPVLFFWLAACATEDPGAPGAPPAGEQDEPVSRIELDIERAERTLDRGEDGAAAKALLVAALADPEVTVEERGAARLALSRAHEASGDMEAAVAIIEAELAAHADDRGWLDKDYRDRLRELLTGTRERPGSLDPYKQAEAPPFAHALTKYFPVSSSGRYEFSFISIGGDRDTSDKLGTFDVDSAIRADLEKSCPLCDHDLDMHTSFSRSDWAIIPAQQARFDRAMLIFYYDFAKNRIPRRYEHHLPMTVEAIERELDQGKSFAIAAEREGAPPVVLIAAPRPAMLADAEEQLAKLDHLPLEQVTFDVSRVLRPPEIQGVIRSTYFPGARGCYKALLERDPDAGGKVFLRFVITAAGALTELEVTAEPGLREAEFEQCMTEQAQGLKFPVSDDKTTVKYPIVFSP